MSPNNRESYEHTLQAVAICIAARIPVLLWGDPGSGKTAAIESAREVGYMVEPLVASHFEPSDFAGLPIIEGRSVTMAPPAWAVRLAEHDGPAILFLDELSTASPSVQAAALRMLTHHEVGALTLPDTVSFVAAANPADVAAAGWDLAPPTASRFIHLEWALPLELFAEASVTGTWPSLEVPEIPANHEDFLRDERVLVSGYLRARQSQLSAIPTDAADRGRAYPNPRTWTYATELAALASAVGAPRAVVRLLVSGAIGDAAAHEYLNWRSNLDLPDPEDVIAFPQSVDWANIRPDRAYVVLQSVLAAISNKNDANRWTNAMTACFLAAEGVGKDEPTPIVKALLRDGRRPPGAELPAGITIFAPVLRDAGLLGA